MAIAKLYYGVPDSPSGRTAPIEDPYASGWTGWRGGQGSLRTTPTTTPQTKSSCSERMAMGA